MNFICELSPFLILSGDPAGKQGPLGRGGRALPAAGGQDVAAGARDRRGRAAHEAGVRVPLRTHRHQRHTPLGQVLHKSPFKVTPVRVTIGLQSFRMLYSLSPDLGRPKSAAKNLKIETIVQYASGQNQLLKSSCRR